MKTNILPLFSDQKDNNELNLINKKISIKKDSLIAEENSNNEYINNNKDINFIKKKIHIKLPLYENNSYSKSINKLSFEPSLKITKSRDSFQTIIKTQSEGINIDSIKELNLDKIKKPININIQNININNYHYYKYPFPKKNVKFESDSEVFPLITNTCPNIENINNNNNVDNLNYNKIINNNHFNIQKNNFSIQFNKNYFRKNFRRVRLVDLKKIKNHQNEKRSAINSERTENKNLDFILKNKKETNSNPILINEKEKEKEKDNLENPKIEIIKGNEDNDSFIDELTEILINVDEKDNNSISKNNNNYNLNNHNYNNNIENNINNSNYKYNNNSENDILNKSFDMREEEEEYENEKKDEKIKLEIPKIYIKNNNQLRPCTSYGGICERKKNNSKYIRGQSSKN